MSSGTGSPEDTGRPVTMVARSATGPDAQPAEGATSLGRHHRRAGLIATFRAKRHSRRLRRLLPRERPPKDPVDYVEHFERATSLRQQLLQNAVPITSAAIFAFVVLKIALISHANTNTALAIVESAGTVQIFTGVMILALPFLATGINNAIAIWAGSDSKFNRFERRQLWSAFAVSLLYLASILPYTSTILLLLFALFYTARWLWRRRKVPTTEVQPSTQSSPGFDVQKFLATEPDDIELRRIWRDYRTAFTNLTEGSAFQTGTEARANEEERFRKVADAYNERSRLIQKVSRPTVDVAAVILLLTVLGPVVRESINDKVWLPPEAVTLTSDEVVGYVVSSESDWTTVLRESDRQVVRLRTTDVKSRTICHLRGTQSRTITLWNMIGRQRPHDYRECPKT